MPITDLTGYTWEFNDYDAYSIVQYFPKSFIETDDELPLLSDFTLANGYSLILSGTNLLNNTYFTNESGYLISVWDMDAGNYTGIYFGNSLHFYKITNQGASFNTISITGGTDATNPDLIAWLEANGTLTAPQPTGTNNVYIGTLSLAKAFVGNNEISQIWLGNNKIYEKGA